MSLPLESRLEFVFWGEIRRLGTSQLFIPGPVVSE